MITATSSSEKNKRSPNRRFFNTQFFRFQLKTGWPLFVVFAFLFILGMVIPTVKFVSVMFDGYYSSINDIRSDTLEYLYILGVVHIVISMFGGLLCGITTMRYTSNKVSVNFYHSLPMRREALFLASTLHSFVYYLAAFVTGLAVTYSIVAIRIGDIGMFLRPMFLTFEYGVLFFFLVYAMTLFAASLTGTGFMRFVGAMYVIFLPAVTVMLFLATISVGSINNSILNVDHYFSDFLISLCTPLRLINLVKYDDLSSGTMFAGAINKDIVIVFLTALVMYGLAFLLYAIRSSESASRPVIWKPAAFVFKYASIFMGGTVFGLMFAGMFESTGWMVIGIIIGSVITFMMVNGILNKSSRAMFKGIKGFGVYLSAMAVITVVFYCDVFGMFSSIPNPSFVNKVELCINYDIEAEYNDDFAYKATKFIAKTFEDDQNFDYNNSIIYAETEYYENGTVEEIYSEEAVTADDKDILAVGQTYAGYSYDHMTVEAVFHTKIGFPLAVRFYPNCETVKGLAEFVNATGNGNAEIPSADNIDYCYANLYSLVYSYDNSSYDEGVYFEDDLTGEKAVELIEKLSDPIGVNAQSPIVGEIYVRCSDYDANTYYICANDIEVLNKLMIQGDKFETEDDVIEHFIELNDIKDVYVINNATLKRVHITDEAKIKETVSALAYFVDYFDYPMLCRKDHNYNVFIHASGVEYNFRIDAIPDEIAALFE